MAKMTISGIKELATQYVAAAKQAGVWSGTTDNIYRAVDKIGRMLMLDGSFIDKLPEMDSFDLPLGRTIEEYYINLVLPEVWQGIEAEAAKNDTPALPSVEDCSYSYTLGRTKIKTTQPMDNIERAALTDADAANMIAKILERLGQSYEMFKFTAKKQLLGNAIAKANAAGLSNTVAVPVDATTGEKFIEECKKEIENASFAHEGGIAKALIGAAPSLVLYVKKGVVPNLQVQTFSGAFNKDDLSLGVTVKVVDDFGDNADGTYAVLLDPRGVKLHRGYHAIRTHTNADGDFINYVDHSEHSGFISKYTFIKTFKAE